MQGGGKFTTPNNIVSPQAQALESNKSVGQVAKDAAQEQITIFLGGSYSYPLISIIVPCYKVERYLPKCIESILCQTYKNLEIILVDDGSPDQCGEICDEYAAKDSRIKVIHKENGGQSDARNMAIDMAHGECITFVDSDDFVEREYVETLYSLIEKHKCDISIVSYKDFRENAEPHIAPPSGSNEYCYQPTEAIETMFYQEVFDTQAWCKMFHRSLFETGIRFPTNIIYEDLATIYLLFAKSNKIAYANKCLYYYLIRKDSSEGSAFSAFKMDSVLRTMELMEQHHEINSLVRNAYCCRMLSLAFHVLLKMPEGYEHRDILYNRIKQYRRSVLFDRKARKKARVASLLSYFGIETVKSIFSLIDKRK